MIRTCLAFAFIATSLLAQDAKPKLVMEKTNHDFGKIEKTSEAKTTFKFQNTGKAELVITDVSTSCGCTTAKPEKTTYAPGESGEIPVSFNPSRFNGVVEKRVTIVSNDPENPRMVVSIRAEVLTDLSVVPESVMVPKLNRQTPQVQEITVSAEKLANLEITELKADQEFLKPTMEKLDAKRVKIMVSLDGSKVPAGDARASGNVTFQTNSQAQREVRIPFTVMMETPVSVQPTAVYMFGTRSGTAREVVLSVAGREGEKLEISKVSFDVKMTVDGGQPAAADIFRYELTPAGVDRASLKVILSEKATPGRFEGQILLQTNSKEMPEVRVPLRGNVIQPEGK